MILSDGLKSRYLRYCEMRGLAETTVYMRGLEIDKFYGWISRQRPFIKLEDMKGEEMISYIKSRSVFRSKVTVYGVVSRLRDFGEYLLRKGLWVENPLRWIKGPHIDPNRKLPSGIGKKDQEKIWKEVLRLRDEYERLMWLTILSLLYGIGIRRGELERLKCDDWDREKGLLRIDGRKTGCERMVPLPEITWRCLESYLPARYNILERMKRTDEKMLLISSRGTVLKGEHISKRLKRITKRAGVPGITLHRFRHTCATDLLGEGIGLCQIQHILGHKEIANTFRYSHVGDPERINAMAKHPVNRILCELKNGGNCDGRIQVSSTR